MAKVETEEEYQWRAIEERDEACVVDAIEYEKEKARVGGFWNDHSFGFDRGWDKCQAWTRANPSPEVVAIVRALRVAQDMLMLPIRPYLSDLRWAQIADALAAFDSAVKGPQ